MFKLVPRTHQRGIQCHFALPVAVTDRGLRGWIEFLEVAPSETAAAFCEALDGLHRRRVGSSGPVLGAMASPPRTYSWLCKPL